MSHFHMVMCDMCNATAERPNVLGPESDRLPDGWFSLYLVPAGKSYLLHQPGQINQGLRPRDYCSFDCAREGLEHYRDDWEIAIRTTAP